MAAGRYCVYAGMDEPPEPPNRKVRPTSENWISTGDAVRLLGVSSYSIYALTGTPCIRKRSRSLTGRSAKANGWLWYRPDVERLRVLMRVAKLSRPDAVRLLELIDAGDIGVRTLVTPALEDK